MKKTTAEQARDALKHGRTTLAAAIKSAWDGYTDAEVDAHPAIAKMDLAITALELDIAQAVEPVQWQVDRNGEWEWCKEGEIDFYKSCNLNVRPLYAAPREPAAPDVNAELLTICKKHVELLIEVAQELKNPRMPLATVARASVDLLAEAAKELMTAIAKATGSAT